MSLRLTPCDPESEPNAAVFHARPVSGCIPSFFCVQPFAEEDHPLVTSLPSRLVLLSLPGEHCRQCFDGVWVQIRQWRRQ